MTYLSIEGGGGHLLGRGGEAKGGRKDAENDGSSEHFPFLEKVSLQQT